METLKNVEAFVTTAKPQVIELLNRKTSRVIEEYLERILWMLDTIEGELDYQQWHKKQILPDPDCPFQKLIRRTERFIHENIGEDFQSYDAVADGIDANREFVEAHSFELNNICVTIFWKDDYEFSYAYHAEKPLTEKEKQLLEFLNKSTN